MKKFLALVLIMLTFLIGGEVKADNNSRKFTAGAYVPDLYVRSKLGAYTRFAQYMVINREDGVPAYCLEPFKDLKTNYKYTLVTSNIPEVLGIEEDVWEDIQLIMYYGFHYTEHFSPYWHAVTQMLVWQKVKPEGVYEYTDTLNGTTVTKYAKETQELLNLVAEHKKRPDFSGESFTVNVGEDLVLTDVNSKISEYEITSTPGVTTRVEGDNKLIVTGLTKGNNTITVTKNYDNKREPSAIYTDNGDAQILGVVGKLPTYTKTININVTAGKISVDIKRPDNVYSNCNNGLKTTYGLFDGEKLVETFDGSLENLYVSKELPMKKYYVKQLTHACNDKEDKNIYEVEIKNDNPNPKVTIEVKENKKEIVILKKFGNKFKNNYALEENATFNLTDGKKTFPLTTNNLGEARITLGYGTYTLSQVTGKDNHELISEQTINIGEGTPDTYYLNYINEEILGSLKVTIKREEDYYSNCSNGNETTYGLFEKDTNALIRTFNAKEDGTYDITNLPLKEYYVKQIANSCNDYQDDYIYEAKLSKEKQEDSINITVKEHFIELTINKKYGSLLDGKYTLERDAVFTLGDANKSFTLTTNTKGNAKIKIGYGTYTLKQIAGKDNYAFVDTQEIVIDENTPEDYLISLINEEILSNIKVILKDEEGNLLANVLVGLYKGTRKVEELMTNDKGEVYFTNLNLRDYTLKQLSIPEGYEDITNNETITLTAEDGLVVFINKKKIEVVKEEKQDSRQVEEEVEKIEVPDTYINGDGKIIKVSSMLLTMALYLLVYGNKKRHN